MSPSSWDRECPLLSTSSEAVAAKKITQYKWQKFVLPHFAFLGALSNSITDFHSAYNIGTWSL